MAPPIEWPLYMALKIFPWLEPLAYAIGLVASVWAYRASRRRGYALVAIYFFLAVCTLTLVPAINRARINRWEARSELSAEAKEEYGRDLLAVQRKYYPSPPPNRINIPFPLGPIILVSGIWLLARHEAKKRSERVAVANDSPPDTHG